MKAIVITDFATEPTLADLPVPDPGPGQLLVRLHAAGLNPFDWKVADGALKDVVSHAFPLVMGSDGAGVVEKTGPGVTRFRVGDRVYGQFMRLDQGLGSYAEYTVADENGVIARIPDTLPFTLTTAPPDLADHLRDLGAGTVIDFTAGPAHEQVAAAHPGGIDAVLDLVTPPGGDPSALAG
jgi:NADPH:quinone reductase-like Zn-dependent oxidoreductase